MWQAYQYRGELYLRQADLTGAARDDFSAALRLAPGEPHLYVLRGRAYTLLGDDSSAQRDYARAAESGLSVAPLE